jgi:hypothetical protein
MARELFPRIDPIMDARVPVVPLLPRQRLYGIGMGKSGTHALASLFKGIAVAHEPEAEPLIRTILDHVSGHCGWEALDALVRDRDARLNLVVDVSNVNIFIVDLLMRIDPDARFVLTIRDCYSWLNSFLNHYLRVNPTATWRAFAEYRFRKDDAAYPPAEHILEKNGLYQLEGYLGYWHAHLSKAIEAVPPSRLFVVRVNEIGVRASEIAAFAGFDVGTVDPSRINEFRNPKKCRIIEEIPRAHLLEQVDRHCRSLMQQFFPEIRTPMDAGV